MGSKLIEGLVVVLLFGLLSIAEGRLTNVTFTNPRGEFVLQSPNFPNNAPPASNQIWEFTSPPGSRVILQCGIRLLERVGCTEGSLTIWDGLTQLNLCSALVNFQRTSIRNKMFVQFRSGFFGVGMVRCVARVLQTASNPLDNFDDLMNEPTPPAPVARTTSCPCGWNNRRRIVGGTETGINEFIFPVHIRFANERQGFCGGSIITRRHILTAAHCVFGNNRSLQIVAGDHDIRTHLETNATQVINVVRTILHNGYNNDQMIHDIAILELQRDITFNQLVGPVCIPNERYNLLNRHIKVLGWGRTSTNGAFSPVLLKANLQVIDLRRCVSRYSNFIDTITPRQICTFSENRDSCQGDSGGPLIIQDPEIDRNMLVALVSYGKECASEDPAVNVDVAAYHDWIQQIVRAHTPAVTTCEKV